MVVCFGVFWGMWGGDFLGARARPFREGKRRRDHRSIGDRILQIRNLPPPSPQTTLTPQRRRRRHVAAWAAPHWRGWGAPAKWRCRVSRWRRRCALGAVRSRRAGCVLLAHSIYRLIAMSKSMGSLSAAVQVVWSRFLSILFSRVQPIGPVAAPPGEDLGGGEHGMRLVLSILI